MSVDQFNKSLNFSPSKSQYLKKYEHCGAISYTLFLKFYNDLKFDENIGVGSNFGLLSGEETDYLIKVISKNNDNIYYDKNIKVYHPRSKFEYFESEIMKMYYYSRGYGYIMRKHNYPLILKIKAFIRPLGGVLWFCILFKPNLAKRSLGILKGRLEGFLFKFKNEQRV